MSDPDMKKRILIFPLPDALAFLDEAELLLVVFTIVLVVFTIVLVVLPIVLEININALLLDSPLTFASRRALAFFDVAESLLVVFTTVLAIEMNALLPDFSPTFLVSPRMNDACYSVLRHFGCITIALNTCGKNR